MSDSALATRPSARLELKRISRELHCMKEYVASGDKPEMGRALIGNLQTVISACMEREKQFTDIKGNLITWIDPDGGSVVRAYDLIWKILQDIPPAPPVGDLDTWRKVVERALATPELRREMMRVIEEKAREEGK